MDPDAIGMDGMLVARVRAFLSFSHEDEVHHCALVEWFQPDAEEPDPTTGMWIVRPEVDGEGERVVDVIPLSSIVRGCHLIGVYGTTRIPANFHYSDSLDAFRTFYVNWYVDYHAHETIA